MRVRVWISGEEGASHDFELLDAPRAGDRISISLSGGIEDGVVSSVSWHLQGVERASGDLSLDGEPVGSVAIVHVVCHRTAEVVALHHAAAEVDPDRRREPTGVA